MRIRRSKSSGLADKRAHMVDWQIRTRGIHDDRLLEAFRRVPRERFIPPHLADRAYEDGPLPIGERQTISQPYIVALMTSMLGLSGGERVLEIGTGSGYQTAILAAMGAQVYTVEIIETLSTGAHAVLADLGYANVHFRVGDGTGGWAEHAPYSRVMVTAAPRHAPQALLEQLELGGCAVLPVGEYRQQLMKVVREPHRFRQEEHGGVVFVPMTGEALDL